MKGERTAHPRLRCVGITSSGSKRRCGVPALNSFSLRLPNRPPQCTLAGDTETALKVVVKGALEATTFYSLQSFKDNVEVQQARAEAHADTPQTRGIVYRWAGGLSSADIR